MTKRKRLFILGLSVAIFFGLAVVYRMVRPRPVEASAVEVRIDNFSFSPTSLVVKAGTQITWTNRDDIPHTVVEEDKVFQSRVLDTDEKFMFTPTKPGTYTYYCSLHPKMTGKVIVR